MAFDAVDKMHRGVALITESHVVEDEELRFRPEERGVGDAGALQICFGFFGNPARVAIVRLARDRIDDRADQDERRFGVEDIDPSRRRIGNDEHVGGVDDSPAADARPVEAEPIFENFLIVFGERGGEMLPRPEQVGELEVYNFTSWSLIILLTSDGVLSLEAITG